MTFLIIRTKVSVHAHHVPHTRARLCPLRVVSGQRCTRGAWGTLGVAQANPPLRSCLRARSAQHACGAPQRNTRTARPTATPAAGLNLAVRASRGLEERTSRELARTTPRRHDRGAQGGRRSGRRGRAGTGRTVVESLCSQTLAHTLRLCCASPLRCSLRTRPANLAWGAHAREISKTTGPARLALRHSFDIPG